MSLKNKLSSLIQILKETNIDEIEISSLWGAQKIRVSNKKKYNHDVSVKDDPAHINQSASLTIDKDFDKSNIEEKDNITTSFNTQKIKAPLVGTYYSSPNPDTPPFIKIGDKIKKGQTICIIEAMKIFNEIESDYNGTVVDILIENRTPVEFDQDLIIIK